MEAGRRRRREVRREKERGFCGPAVEVEEKRRRFCWGLGLSD
jgi:hypothetical protein